MSEEITSVFSSAGLHPLTANKSKEATGDTDAKRILKYRIVLANILKYIIPAYKDFQPEEIAERIPKSTLPDGELLVREENYEDLEDRKHIDFDVLFPLNDASAASVAIWCDIEAQKQYERSTPGNSESYDLSARGVYYLSRMISRQIQSRKGNSSYKNLRKCYSIWICFDHLGNKKWEPSITKYRFSPVLDEGTSRPPSQEYIAADLMELIIIRAGGKEGSDNPLIDFINTLWRDTDRLTAYIPETYDGYQIVRKEAASMCDMKEVGRAEGRAEGKAEGKLSQAIATVQRALGMGLGLETALVLAGIDETTYNKYKDSFDENDR